MNLEKQKKLFEKYPFHICVMVLAAKKALDEGRAYIEDGVFIMKPPEEPLPKGIAGKNGNLIKRRKEGKVPK